MLYIINILLFLSQLFFSLVHVGELCISSLRREDKMYKGEGKEWKRLLAPLPRHRPRGYLQEGTTFFLISQTV
jgi:hypothetical protein